MKRFAFVMIVAAIAALLVGIWMVNAQEVEEEGEEDVTVLDISLAEFSFTLEGQEANEAIVLQAGQRYKFEFENNGTVMHEVAFGTDVRTEDDLAVGFDTNIFENVEADIEGEMNGADFEVEVPGIFEMEINPGQKLELSLTIPEDLVGEWELACFVPGHYEAGMVAPLIIEAA
ncbi:MAG: hypothetical protein D6737_04315 [Chloroflexi bacterium]|nr:MAG: hypothetical protein D6737_04315 [Chloroflexota bacterium]